MPIDEYFRASLMPVEGAIPHLAGIEMYGDRFRPGWWAATCSNSLIFSSATIWVRGSAWPRAVKEYLKGHRIGASDYNCADDQVEWLKLTYPIAKFAAVSSHLSRARVDGRQTSIEDVRGVTHPDIDRNGIVDF
jgi:hypothetical protein